ncbi:MAG TPA: biopolymer transporter ExbD [Rhizomicrobium sp.]|nr:biopolymer transporter ExbD [Rhizomicrobium sp.]
MAMSATNAKGEVMVDMNTTPLIDVMLVMLTLLIITLPLQTHAVKLDMPAAVDTPPVVVPTVELGVDFDGSITWNGIPISRATMDAYFADIGKKPVEAQDEIHVNSNRLAKYDAVSKVLADAQRLGASHIGFNGIDQYN